MLAPNQSSNPFSAADSNLADPATLGTHGSSSEVVGLIYSGKAGFLDLGHIRDLCDLTKHIYDCIVSSGGNTTRIRTTHGVARIITPVPIAMWVQVAQSIANDDGFGHEILTYDSFTPGGHNSAFSPEDLCSNFLGTLLAHRAIARGGSFNRAVTTELDVLVHALDGQSKRESLNAFRLINHRWVSFSRITDLASNTYLKRRNFTRNPWKAGHPSDSTTPAFVTASLGTVQAFYTFTVTLSRRIPKSSFAAEIARIRTDAARRYGPGFDRP